MATDWTALYRVGAGWTYNDPDITYNQITYTPTGTPLLYNGTGQTTQYTALSKP